MTPQESQPSQSPIRVDVPGVGIVEFPASMSMAQITSEASRMALTEAGRKAAAPVPAQDESLVGRMNVNVAADPLYFPKQTLRGAKAVAGTAVSALPAIGGAIGGAVGGPLGAAMGGAAGQGYKGLINQAAEIPGAIKDVATNAVRYPAEVAAGIRGGSLAGTGQAATEGVVQGTFQGVGQGVAAGANVMAKWLMNRATTRVSAKLMQEFPELSDILIDKALTVSKGGYEKALGLLRTAKNQANAAIQKATTQGAEVPVQMTTDLAESFKTALLEKAVKGGTVGKVAPGQTLTAATERLDPATKALFLQVEQAAQKGGVVKLTPVQADALKTQLQKESRVLYAQRGAPNGPKAMGMDATERAEFASRLNDAIGEVAAGYRAGNAAAKPMIGATRGIRQAIRPSGNLMQAMVRPGLGAVAGWQVEKQRGGSGLQQMASAAAGAAMTSPAGMSREAIILAHPVIQAALRQLPRATAEALRGFLGEQLPVWLRTGSGQQEPPQ